MEPSIRSFSQKKVEEEPVHVILEEGVELPTRLQELKDKFLKCFSAKKYHIILNLKNIKLPPSRFIVTLIEVTSQARRMGGDIKLINLDSSIRNNLVTFSPRTYLSIETSERYALHDFGETFLPVDELDNIEKTTVAAPSEINLSNGKVEEKRYSYSRESITYLDFLKLARDEIRVNTEVQNLYKICEFVLERAEKAGFDLRERGKIKVTVYEACLNVVEHAYFSNPEYWINVYVGYDEEKFVIVIQDWGESFEFDPSDPYDVEQAVKDRRTGGFGLHIIRRSVDQISYLCDSREGNRLILVKNIKNKRT